MLVKLVNGCWLNDHWWVLGSAAKYRQSRSQELPSARTAYVSAYVSIKGTGDSTDEIILMILLNGRSSTVRRDTDGIYRWSSNRHYVRYGHNLVRCNPNLSSPCFTIFIHSKHLEPILLTRPQTMKIG